MKFIIHGIETIDCSSGPSTVYPNPESIDLLLDILYKICESNIVRSIIFINTTLHFKSGDSIGLKTPYGNHDKKDVEGTVEELLEEEDDKKEIQENLNDYIIFNEDDKAIKNKTSGITYLTYEMAKKYFDEDIYILPLGLKGLKKLRNIVIAINNHNQNDVPRQFKGRELERLFVEIFVNWRELGYYDKEKRVFTPDNQRDVIKIDSSDMSILFNTNGLAIDHLEEDLYQKFLEEVQALLNQHWPGKFEADDTYFDYLIKDGKFINRKTGKEHDLREKKNLILLNETLRRDFNEHIDKDELKKLEENLKRDDIPFITCEKHLYAIIIDDELDLEDTERGFDFNNLEGFENFKSLRSISFNSCWFDTIPDWLPTIKSLKEIDLCLNHLKDFPVILSALPEIEILDLSSNDLLTIPNSINDFKKLKILKIGRNEYKTLPRITIELEELDISDNDFEIIPDLSHMQALKRLDLSILKLGKIPDWVFQLYKLEELYLHANGISQIPNDIEKLQSIKRLSLSHNKIEELPGKISFPRQIENLNLENNNLRKFPEFLRNAKTLKTLNFTHNKLLILPDWIDELNSIENLYLTARRGLYIADDEDQGLHTLPESIGKMISLKFLDLANNQIEELPSSMRNLDNLEFLNLTDNLIEILPSWFLELKSLKKIYLNGNPVMENPDSASLEIMNQLREKDIIIDYTDEDDE